LLVLGGHAHVGGGEDGLRWCIARGHAKKRRAGQVLGWSTEEGCGPLENGGRWVIWRREASRPFGQRR
jgi:hypothetical protein